jgi:LCP family protein required for cell wall assembly
MLVVIALGAVAGAVILRNRLDQGMERFGDPFVGLPTRPPVVASSDPSIDPSTDPSTGATAMNLLVLGSDSRVSAGDPSSWQVGAQRTDAIMLVHLPADGSGAYVMSIPRDSWVDVPGHGKAKINAAFSYGGPALLIQTVEQLTNVRVDHFAVADFTSFKQITDELGGVQITLKEDLVDRGTFIAAAGKQLLTGEQALVYVRQRKNLARGDFDRVQRQQAWMRAIFARMRNEQTLQNPTKSYPFLQAVTRSVSVDDGVTQAVTDDLVKRAKGLGSTDIAFFTVPVQGTARSADGQSIVVLDAARFDQLMAAVAADRVGQYLDAHPGDVDVLPPVAP